MYYARSLLHLPRTIGAARRRAANMRAVDSEPMTGI
jgi:hypothetical protein